MSKRRGARRDILAECISGRTVHIICRFSKSAPSDGPCASAVCSADENKSAGQDCVIARTIRADRLQCGWEKVRTGGIVVLTVTRRQPRTPPLPPAPHSRKVSGLPASRGARAPLALYIYIYMYMYICVYVFVCMYVCMCLCYISIYIYIYIYIYRNILIDKGIENY